MKKSFIVLTLTFVLFVGMFATPTLAHSTNRRNHNYNNIIHSTNTYGKYTIITTNNYGGTGISLRLHNWYANMQNNKPVEYPWYTNPNGDIQETPVPEHGGNINPIPNPVPEQEKQPEPIPQQKPEEKPNVPTSPQGIGDQQAKMLMMVNEERAKAGLQTLKWDGNLANVAQTKAADMSSNNYFDHNSPTYGSPFEMMKKFGISYKAAGENLAGSSNVDRAHIGLMNSDGHRKNILNPNFTHIGIGVEKSQRYGYVYVQMFVGR